jgi:Protein of unknown function (DUF559)
MPRGIYPRTPNQLAAAKANLAKGRQPEARAKAQQSLRRIASDPRWRAKVSRATKAAMRRADVRDRHLRAMEGQPIHLKGGNGRPQAERVEAYLTALKWLGWIPEYVIKTKGHRTLHNPPMAYKADLANPNTMTVLEMDGSSHRPRQRQELDRKKTEVLRALGWTVIRINH